VIAPDINGLVLCGGKSTRMGVDKSTVQYHGAPQVDYLAEQLKTSCNAVFVSTYLGSKLRTSFPLLPDRFDFKSPLNGILSALHFNPGVAWLAVAVDMPNVNTIVLKDLIRQRDKSKLATCFYNHIKHFPEPLLTIWEPAAFKPLMAFVGAGQISPKEFLAKHDVKLVESDGHVHFMNINTPEELERYRREFNKD
jgi:molybdopterin-guanine dinucleotide biosynthesis protein A